MTKDNLTWLMEWYAKQCIGDWEHSYGIRIDTIDNPGWSLTIDMGGENADRPKDIAWHLVENNEKDWYGYKMEDGKFEASGDPLKLHFLIHLFREIVDSQI